MFYLGGLTLGYLTPYPTTVEPAAGTVDIKAVKAAKSEKASAVRRDGDNLVEEPPLLWPWHMFC